MIGSSTFTRWLSKPAAPCRPRDGPALAVAKPSPLSANTTGLGYIYSFNGPHSLFVDTMRTLRSLGVAWQLGHKLMHENDRAADLLKRLVLHGLATNQYILSTATLPTYTIAPAAPRTKRSQSYRRPVSQPLHPARLFPLQHLDPRPRLGHARLRRTTRVLRNDRTRILHIQRRPPEVRCRRDLRIRRQSHLRSLPQRLHRLRRHSLLGRRRPRSRKTRRLAKSPRGPLQRSRARRFFRRRHRRPRPPPPRPTSGRSSLHPRRPRIAKALFSAPYLSESADHQGLLLHSIYHRPNGWDHVPKGRKIPYGESSLWGDYTRSSLLSISSASPPTSLTSRSMTPSQVPDDNEPPSIAVFLLMAIISPLERRKDS